MHCPFCQNPDSRVVDTRISDDGASIRRRRECTVCKKRFSTLETSIFLVVKRSKVVEPFSRDKVVRGVRKACQNRPVSERDLAFLAQQVEEYLRAQGMSSVSTEEVGKAILPFLLHLDKIAYLRYASVYKRFETLSDFEDAIAELRAQGKELPSRTAAVSHTDSAGSDTSVENVNRESLALSPGEILEPKTRASSRIHAQAKTASHSGTVKKTQRNRRKKKTVPADAEAPSLLD